MFKEKLTHGFERSILSLSRTGLDWIEIDGSLDAIMLRAHLSRVLIKKNF